DGGELERRVDAVEDASRGDALAQAVLLVFGEDREDRRVELEGGAGGDRRRRGGGGGPAPRGPGGGGVGRAGRPGGGAARRGAARKRRSRTSGRSLTLRRRSASRSVSRWCERRVIGATAKSPARPFSECTARKTSFTRSGSKRPVSRCASSPSRSRFRFSTIS